MRLIKVITSFLAASFLLISCAKEYSVETSGRKLHTGNWEFKDSTNEYMGNIDTAYIAEAGNIKQLNLIGKSLDGKENWRLQLFADTFKVGTYKASLFQSAMRYDRGGKIIYDVNQMSGTFAVKISVINGSLITGTFSGSATDSLNTFRNLFEGKFKTNLPKSLNEPPSVGIFSATGGNCDAVLLAGEFKEGIALLPSNTVEVNVIVATPGSYTIFTNDVNGVNFSAQGVFTAPGPQTVTLTGEGTPAFPGNQTFTLHYGNSQCAFSIEFLEGTSASNDYYPVTTNTNWTYEITPGIFIQNKVMNGINTINGKEYNVIGTYKLPNTTTFDTLMNIRKSMGSYYGFFNYGHHSGLNFDAPVYGEHIFLKDNVPAGTSWNAPDVEGIIAGVTMTISLKYSIISKGTPENVGGFDFSDVLKVKEEIYLNSVLYRTNQTWYATNVGPVYYKDDSESLAISDFQIF